MKTSPVPKHEPWLKDGTMRIAYLLILLISFVASGCTGRKEPPYPKDVPGWKDYTDQGIKMRGEFVLKKGETTDNGQLQIKVLELIPPDTLAGTGAFNGLARVKLEFTRLADEKVICVDIFGERQSGLFAKGQESLSKLEITAFEIYAINLKEGWVYFSLKNESRFQQEASLLLPGCQEPAKALRHPMTHNANPFDVKHFA